MRIYSKTKANELGWVRLDRNCNSREDYKAVWRTSKCSKVRKENFSKTIKRGL